MYENFCFAVNLVKHANKKVDSCLNFQIWDLARNSRGYPDNMVSISSIACPQGIFSSNEKKKKI